MIVVVQLCLALCDPMNCSMPAFLILYYLCSNSYPLSQWCHPSISSVSLFSSCQPFSTSTFFPMSQLFASGGKSIGASASTTSDYTGLFLWDWLVWSSCRLRDSQVFFSTTVLKHHFFGAQPSLRSKSRICTWLLKNHSFDYADLGQQSDVSAF